MKTVIVTGGDEAFAPLVLDCIRSLQQHDIAAYADLGVIDQGFSDQTRSRLDELGAVVNAPAWPDFVPSGLRDERQLGLTVRPLLRELFPGYDSYLWFDADAWCQDAESLQEFLQGVRARGSAVAVETGPGYRKPLAARRWWVGNLVHGFGAGRGARLALRRSVNIGILGLRDTSPLWQDWLDLYRHSIERTSKLNLDQHAFLAAAAPRSAEVALLDSVHNWLPVLSVPHWDREAGVLREPGGRRRPLGIIHLAGPDKLRTYDVPGARAPMSLSFEAISQHRARSA